MFLQRRSARYIILNLETGHVTDLFPIEENSPSLAITRIQEQEFLLAGIYSGVCIYPHSVKGTI